MNCPHCNVPLSIADRSGIEIDFCPQCRGVWLDRGELDKIIERAGVFASAPAMPAPLGASPPPIPPQQGYQQQPPQRRRDHDNDDDDDSYKYRQQQGGAYPYQKKKKGFLGDLFDL